MPLDLNGLSYTNIAIEPCEQITSHLINFDWVNYFSVMSGRSFGCQHQGKALPGLKLP